MKEPAQIEHKGIVKSINGNELQVSIIVQSSCASCNFKGSCSVSGLEEKIIDVFVANPDKYENGENVSVYYKQSLGFRALFLGYILPFLILVISLIILMLITQNELLSGVISLLILVPYYLILYFSKDKIKKTFTFSIKKSYVYPKINAINI